MSEANLGGTNEVCGFPAATVPCLLSCCGVRQTYDKLLI